MSYTRLADPQTDWARHLDRIRRDHDWSATEMFEDVREALGLGPKSLTSFKPVLVNKPPSERWADVLAARYGAPSPSVAEPTPADLSLQERAVIAAERQAAAAELQITLMARQIAALEALIARQEPQPTTDYPAAIEAMLEWGRSSLERSRSQAPQSDRTPSAGR